MARTALKEPNITAHPVGKGNEWIIKFCIRYNGKLQRKQIPLPSINGLLFGLFAGVIIFIILAINFGPADHKGSRRPQITRQSLRTGKRKDGEKNGIKKLAWHD